MKMTDQELVTKDKEALYIGNLNTVEADLHLPLQGVYGSEISWESHHPVFLSHDGKVKRPAYGMGNRTVQLTARLRHGTAEAVRAFTVRILEAENKLQARKVWPVWAKGVVGQPFRAPAAAIVETVEGDTISHPVTWEREEGWIPDRAGVWEASGRLSGTQIPVRLFLAVAEEEDHPRQVPPEALDDFREASVQIVAGNEFYQTQESMRAYLLEVDADSLLFAFRQAAGLPVKGADPLDGWDAPDSLLRGHTTGHFLSALARCYHSCPDPRILEKVRYLVQGLGECQQAFSRTEGFQPGFLSAYSEEQFDLLEEYTPYPEIWAPYYTLHKILAGLLDCYTYLQDETALQIARDLGDWACRRLGRLSRTQLTRMWSMYIAGEYGGMNEVMARLYQITGKQAYLDCAGLFDNDRLLYPLEQGVDALTGMHANQHIPQVLGALEIFRATGKEKYYQEAIHFWELVTGSRCYAPGGTGEGEMFRQKGRIGSLLTENTQESCASYNMLKLTRELYRFRPEARYMDYYERTLLNHILAASERSSSGETTYFFPLAPGSRRTFEGENSCCHGTGMESPFQFRDALYFRKGDTLYLPLLIPSVLEVPEEDLHIRLEQDARDPEKMHLRLQGPFRTVLLRRPSWCREDAQVQVMEGDAAVLAPKEASGSPFAVPEGYYRLEGDFSQEVLLELCFPFHLALCRTPDCPERAAIQAGPYILAALSDQREFLKLPLREETLEQQLTRQEGSLDYRCGDLLFRPLCQIEQEAYHVYVDVSQ